MRCATSFLENVKACEEFAFRFFTATANDTFAISDIVPIHLAGAASANEDETMLSLLSSPCHPLVSKPVTPFYTVTEN